MKQYKKIPLNSKGFAHHFIIPIVVIALVAVVGVHVYQASHAASSSSATTVYIGTPKSGTVINNGVYIDTGFTNSPKNSKPTVIDYYTNSSGATTKIGVAVASYVGYLYGWNTSKLPNGTYYLYSTYSWKGLNLTSPRVEVTVSNQTKAACTNTLKGSSVIPVDNRSYNLQADEWDSTQPFSICNDGGADFSITSSSINNATNGAPGAYPSIYKGCHWGNCTLNSNLPVLVSTMSSTPGLVTTSYSTTTAGGIWDDSYDIWYNQSSSTNNNQSGLEMMIWLNHTGSVQPIGSVVASNVSIGGNTYNVWHGGSGAGTVSYVMTKPTTSVNNLDLGPLASYAVSRGYMQKSWYLIDVEAGFENWVGGQGLSANSFNVAVK